MRSRMNLFLRHFYGQRIWCCRSYSAKHTYLKQDPAPLFFNDTVQHLLKTLTRVNDDKIFRQRKDESALTSPTYKFMTVKALQNARMRAKREIYSHFLQMPPVVQPLLDRVEVLSNDPGLQGYDTSKFVFTDISHGHSNKSRLIVVRELDGILRHAFPDERRRVNQVYFPIKGREIRVPKFFYDPYLRSLMDRGEYEYILDSACLQFEPNEVEYHRITQEVYEEVNKQKKYDSLRSTRHFGPLVFHLVWTKNFDVLLIDLLKSNNLSEALDLLKLYHIIHPNCKSAPNSPNTDYSLDTLILYAEVASVKKTRMMLALKVYKEEEEKRLEKIKEEDEKLTLHERKEEDVINENVVKEDDVINENVVKEDDVINENVVKEDDVINENVVKEDDVKRES